VSFKSAAQSAVMITFWCAISFMMWWAFGPIQPAITVFDSHSLAWETTTKPGGHVSRLLEFRVNYDVDLRTYRRLVEIDCSRCRTFELEYAIRSYRGGETYRQSRSVSIPEHIPPGRYRMEVEARWQANPFREGFLSIPPFTITVIAPNAPAPKQSRLMHYAYDRGH